LMLMSAFFTPGPRKVFWPQFPNAVAEGTPKVDGLYQFRVVPVCIGVPKQLAN
jgi:hypothetical protein